MIGEVCVTSGVLGITDKLNFAGSKVVFYCRLHKILFDLFVILFLSACKCYLHTE